MARVKKTNLTLDTLFFSTSLQRILRLLLREPKIAFSPRIICSRLKGVRGLGGAEGVNQLLVELQELGLVDFVNNHRAVRLREDNCTVQALQTLIALCDLEGLRSLLSPISSRGVLFGNQAVGKGHSESDYDLLVVTETPEEVKKVTGRHPTGRTVELLVWTPELFSEIRQQDPGLFQKVSEGIVLWGTNW